MNVWVTLTCLLPCTVLQDDARRAPPITALAFAPDGKAVVVGSQAGIEVRAYPGLDKVRTIATTLAHVHDLAFAPDGKALVAVGGAPAKRGSVELYSWPEGKLHKGISPAKDLLVTVCWRPDGKALAVAGADSIVRTFRPTTLEAIKVVEGHSRGVLAASYLADGKQLLSAGLDESVRVWDADKGDLLRTLSNHTRPVLGLAVRLKADTPAVVASIGEDRTLRLWQPTTGRMIRFARLASVPMAVAWSHEGDTLLVACKDGMLRAIDPDTVDVLHEVRALAGIPFSLAVAADGGVLVGGQDGQLKRVVVPSRPTSSGRPAASPSTAPRRPGGDRRPLQSAR